MQGLQKGLESLTGREVQTDSLQEEVSQNEKRSKEVELRLTKPLISRHISAVPRSVLMRRVR
jgi:predicted ATP-grasp superfamily ATP-dependent carboligase